MPYIYSLALQSHLTASPPQRWVGWGYESDPEVWSKFLKEGEEQFWFGDSLLLGGVFQPGIKKARIYLPRKGGEEFDYGYVNTNAPHEYLASGQWVEIASEWKESIPVLAKIGTAVPVSKDVQTRMPGELKPACLTLQEDDYRGVEIFPPRGSSHGRTFSFTWFEDDGIALHPDISLFTIQYSSTDEKVTAGFKKGSDNVFQPPWRDLDIILLPGDEKHVVSDMGNPLENVRRDDKGRQVWRFKV
jgi:alpha-glucosidase (family GH31 glycosyl hydrolase)